MPQGENMPLKKEFLSRPRLLPLLQSAMQQHVVMILAGAGYGKTHAAKEYLNVTGEKHVWLKLTDLDNLPSYFWRHFVHALKRELPVLAEKLEHMEFPDSPCQFDAFVENVYTVLCGLENAIFVFDDFGEITDPAITGFFDMLKKPDFLNLSLVFISAAESGIDCITAHGKCTAVISAEDLSFTPQEICELYSLYDISLSESGAREIHAFTEGWPLPIHTLAQTQRGQYAHDHLRLYEDITHEIFQQQYFSRYSDNEKKLLVRLSLPDYFTEDLAEVFFIGEPFLWENMRKNPFIRKNSSSGRLHFHNLYRGFLNKKVYILAETEQREAWHSAAEYFYSAGEMQNAIVYYHNSGDFDKMLRVIMQFMSRRHPVTPETAVFFKARIEMTDETNIMAQYMHALLCLALSQPEAAEEIIINLENNLSCIEDEHPLTADIRILHGLINMRLAKSGFGLYFQKAAECANGGSLYIAPDSMWTFNFNLLFLLDNKTGAIERVEQEFYSAMPWIARTMHGSMSGMQYLFSAEAAYLTNRLEDAQHHAFSAIYDGRQHSQHDIVCSAYSLLVRIGLANGDIEKVEKYIGCIVTYAEKYDSPVIKDICDMSLAWRFVKLRLDEKVPEVFSQIENIDPVTISYSRTHLVYANYLLSIGEHAQLVSFLEFLKEHRFFRALTQDKILLHVLLAAGYMRLGHNERAMECFWSVYDMCYENKITMPFIEAANYMVQLIGIAKKQEKYCFDSQWLIYVEKEADILYRRTKKLVSDLRGKSPSSSVKNNPLSKREQEVLQAVARGLTREEIAIEQYISVNTVKSTIRNIFNKLDASNKAEAVSIAITLGHIEGHK